MKKLLVSASTHPAGDNAIEYIKRIAPIIDFVHCDIMDGKFVPERTFSSDVVNKIKSESCMAIDAHLMIKDAQFFIDDYLKIPCNILTLQYEAFKDKKLLFNTLKRIKNSKMTMAGISINPCTSIKEIMRYLNVVDVVLIMSVVAGKSGQKFIDTTIDKITSLKNIINENKLKILIEVDGGINSNNSSKIASAGADIVVIGSALYKVKDKKIFVDKVKRVNDII